MVIDLLRYKAFNDFVNESIEVCSIGDFDQTDGKRITTPFFVSVLFVNITRTRPTLFNEKFTRIIQVSNDMS